MCDVGTVTFVEICDFVYLSFGGLISQMRSLVWESVFRPSSQIPRRCSVHATPSQSLTSFPRTYQEAIDQMRDSTKRALAEGEDLIEIEIPTAGLYSVPGDAEGQNEMDYSMEYLHRFCRVFEIMEIDDTVRVFFPEEKELRKAQESGEFGSKLKLDYLMTPSVLMDLGIDIHKKPVADRVSPSDRVFVVGYPHFNVDEILYVEELWSDLEKQSESRPIIIFNGELDRLRSGYYPGLFYPKISKISKSFIPKFTQSYYIHNFKGRHPGALFRRYPEPWQILRRDRRELDQLVLIETVDQMPSLKEIALNILPQT